MADDHDLAALWETAERAQAVSDDQPWHNESVWAHWLGDPEKCRFLATFSPDAALALLDRVEQAERERDAAKDERDAIQDGYDSLKVNRDRLSQLLAEKTARELGAPGISHELHARVVDFHYAERQKAEARADAAVQEAEALRRELKEAHSVLRFDVRYDPTPCANGQNCDHCERLQRLLTSLDRRFCADASAPVPQEDR